MSTSQNQTGQRSFDDLYEDIWKPQAIAALQVNNQIQPADVNSMSPTQYIEYRNEVARLTKAKQIRQEIESERKPS